MLLLSSLSFLINAVLYLLYVYIFIKYQNTRVQTRINVSILVYMGLGCYLTKVKAKKIIKLFNVGGFPRAKLKEHW